MSLRNELSFEGQVKPDAIAVDSYEPDLSAARIVSIPSNQQTLIDYVSGVNPIYVGTAPKGYATSSGTDNDITKPNWLIKKITWDTNNNPTQIQIGWGKWDNRATTVTYS
jgi:hypothetical protein